MADIINFTVEYDQLTNESIPTPGDDVGTEALVGWVHFDPQFVDAKPIMAKDLLPRPAGLRPRRFSGYIDSDGRLRPERGSDEVGVRLWANDPVLELASPLTYKVSFDLTTPMGEKVRVDGGYLPAPDEDITVNLTDVLESTGYSSVSTPPTFYTLGDVASPIGMDLITSEDAAAARLVIGAASADIEIIKARAEIYVDPRSRPDGPITAGSALDFGTVFSNTGPRKLKYVGGRIVHDPASTIGSNTAGYLQVEVPTGLVRSMRAETAFVADSLGSIAFVIPSTLGEWNWDISQLPAAGVHLTAYGNGIWNVAVWNPSPGAAGRVDHSVQPGTATSFTLTVETSSGTHTTASISASATALQVASAIEALPNVASGQVSVTKSSSGNFGISWASALAPVTLSAAGSGGTMGMPAPLPLDPGNSIAAVESYSTGLNIYGDYTTVRRYTSVDDDVMRPFAVFLSPENDEIYVAFPDGTGSGPIKHPGIGLWAASNRAVFELFESNSIAIDDPASFGRIAVSNQIFHWDGNTPELSDVMEAARASAESVKPIVLYDGGNVTSSNITVGGDIPTGTKWIELVCIAGGGGGGGGGCQPSGTAVNGGSGGGSGGVIREVVPASALGTTWGGVIGKAGLGGASISATGTGNNGTDGTSTKWYSGSVVFEAYPGGKGNGGTSGATPAVAGNPGGPFATAGAASGINGAVGASGAQMYTALGNPGAAAGGGITTAPTANNGGAGGANLVRGYFGGTAGIVGGAAPGRGKDATGVAITTTPAGIPGPGPGGGAASSTGAAQDGAHAAGWGGGGGGGGASLNGKTSGAGGDGKGGYLIAIAHFV